MLSILLKKTFENFDGNLKNYLRSFACFVRVYYYSFFLRPYSWNPNYVPSSRKTNRKDNPCRDFSLFYVGKNPYREFEK